MSVSVAIDDKNRPQKPSHGVPPYVLANPTVPPYVLAHPTAPPYVLAHPTAPPPRTTRYSGSRGDTGPRTSATGIPQVDATTGNTRLKGRTAVKCFLIVFMLTIIIVILFRPLASPKYKVDSISISLYNGSYSTNLIVKWNISISVTNPNMFNKAVYNDLSLSIFYQNGYVSGFSIPPFHQGCRSRTFLNTSANALLQYDDNPLTSAIIKDWTKGVMEFDVKLRADLKNSYFFWCCPIHDYNILLCKNLKIHFLSNATQGAMLSGSQICVYDMY
ncbi:LEA 2 domain-containing protein [Abeliophyllum distichum]|uniref:LEA 2 domain-containing protein n=1 Tax=Abeliophyllum distichum TaxID=126358 RepID=A0ABD1QUM6_9LAMI